MTTLQDVNIHLTSLFRLMNLPQTGVTKAWLNNVALLQSYCDEVIAEHGIVGARLIDSFIPKLKQSGKGAWAIRDVLAELSVTIGAIEADLCEMDEAELPSEVSTDGDLIGMWTCYLDDPEGTVYWDQKMFALCGVDSNFIPSKTSYTSLLADETERLRLIRKMRDVMEQKTNTLRDVHTIRRVRDGAMRHVLIKGECGLTPTNIPFISGYVRDVTETHTILPQLPKSLPLDQIPLSTSAVQ
jgi:hypothetical protein